MGCGTKKTSVPRSKTKVVSRAAVHSFQGRGPEQNGTEVEDFHLSNSTILNYTGIEKREALTSVGKCLVDGM